MKVFWSWQSDTSGNTGRHFIRQVLNDAIETLKQPEDVEEPSERDAKDSLHLDHDRLGVPGSPRLLETILKKIDASTVFIGDVTAVATIPGVKIDGRERREKRNMNPNVAIELGYAFKSITELNVLMVMNTHYGGREFLPFDLAGNAGPIMFHLPPDADATQIRAEAAKLKGQFVTALREFLKGTIPPEPELTKTPCTSSLAAFFKVREVLASFGEAHDREEYGFITDQGVYLKVLPRVPPPQSFRRTQLMQALNQSQLDALSNNGLGLRTPNRYGAAMVTLKGPRSGMLESCTQVFPNGELWGFAPWMLEDHGYGKLISEGGVERVMRRALPTYLGFAEALGLGPPFIVELGAVGIEGYSIAVDADRDTNLGPIYDDMFSESVILNETNSTAQSVALLGLFKAFCAISGYPRPAQVNGFPGARGP